MAQLTAVIIKWMVLLTRQMTFEFQFVPHFLSIWGLSLPVQSSCQKYIYFPSTHSSRPFTPKFIGISMHTHIHTQTLLSSIVLGETHSSIYIKFAKVHRHNNNTNNEHERTKKKNGQKIVKNSVVPNSIDENISRYQWRRRRRKDSQRWTLCCNIIECVFLTFSALFLSFEFAPHWCVANHTCVCDCVLS